MRITIVSGFFLPIPPLAGGATEKSWYRLARIFAQHGHEVTVVSRRWPGLSDREHAEGISHLRLRGHDHRRRLGLNLFLDFLWSWRVFFALPPGDIVVVHAVTLPVWLARLRPAAGRVVLMAGRMPKGQFRHYRGIAQVLAASGIVSGRVRAENPALGPVSTVVGYPIDWQRLQAADARDARTVTLGFIGRLHEEKGLRLLCAALARLAGFAGLPPWRVLFCGPAEVARGGSGPEFVASLRRELAVLPPGAVEVLPPEFDEGALAAVYQRIDVFCYPSLAEQGETFGVAVAEAMAAGAVPVVSRLACFTDFVTDGVNGAVFDHRSPEAAMLLAETLARLLREPDLRHRLAAAGRETVRRYDYPAYAGSLLAAFRRLTGAATPPSSAP